MGQIVWLASYPKSGNTWLRIFLANLLRTEPCALDINALSLTEAGSAQRYSFDKYVGVDSADLTKTEIDCFRPRVYEAWAAECPTTLFCKCHDAYSYTNEGEALLSKAAGTRAIYLVRNPLDVAVSWASHNRSSVAKAIEVMADANKCIEQSENSLATQLHQRLTDWSSHVNSWLDEPDLELCLARYEDMVLRPEQTFGKIIDFLGLDFSHKEIREALAASSFVKLRQLEEEFGFKERPRKVQRFFREGKVGSWRNEISNEEVEQVIRFHEKTMLRLNYLTNSGLPFF